MHRQSTRIPKCRQIRKNNTIHAQKEDPKKNNSQTIEGLFLCPFQQCSRSSERLTKNIPSSSSLRPSPTCMFDPSLPFPSDSLLRERMFKILSIGTGKVQRERSKHVDLNASVLRQLGSQKAVCVFDFVSLMNRWQMPVGARTRNT